MNTTKSVGKFLLLLIGCALTGIALGLIIKNQYLP